MSSPERHELLVIGGGPAGLSAAMSAEDNGIDSLVIDATELGGQASTATLIENYPGFSEGISGPALISNIIDQALKYNTGFEALTPVVDIHNSDEGILVTTDAGTQYLGRNAILSIGLEPRKLKVRNLAAYIQRGVKYDTPDQGEIGTGQSVCIFGGSDGAAQTAVHLAESGHEVNLIMRGEDLRGRARQSLLDKIEDNELIHIYPNSELVSVDGNGLLEQITIRDKADQTHDIPTHHLFVLIGSEPRTRWLPESIAKDKQGFVLTGSLIDEELRHDFLEASNGRPPYNHETSMPGLFAAGDIRSGIRKMVTFAILDGASVIPEIQELEIHNRLKGPSCP